jgi:hypothetical protein
MFRGRSRWLLRLAILPLAAVAMLLWANQQRGPDVLIVENQSGQPIATLQVTVGGRTSKFYDVAIGASVSAPVGKKTDEPFIVKGKLEDGAIVHSQGPFQEGATLVVRPGGRIIVQQAGK